LNLYDHDDKEKKKVDFAAILTGREEVPEVYTLDTALATFQSNDDDNSDSNKKDDLKYSVKITDMDRVKKVSIDVGKTCDKEEVVAELYKSETPTNEVKGNLCEGKINSKEFRGQLSGKDTRELVRKIEKGEVYVNISTEDKPKGKIRGQIKKLR
jgi:hypothetical protein